ncbi:MAG TPA: zinc-binding dehydrogenase [Cytophagales bacterium]|nr:zinc-binding dehydrogenase [Cytophagales bacterium]
MREFYQVEKSGSLKNLKYVKGPIPQIQAGKVLVEVKAVGLNYADIFAVMGLYSATPKGSFIPGLEYSGQVLASASPLFHEGQKIIGVTRFGGYDSHILADPDYLMPLPKGWTFEEGAAFPVQTLTAYYALKVLGNLQAGQTVLIHSAAGGVGLQANRIAKKFNAYTIGVVGHKEKLAVLEAEGFDKGIVRGPQFREDLKNALSGKELSLVLETTGGKYLKYSYEAMAPMGRLISYGSAQFTPSSHKPNYFTLIPKYLFRPKFDPLSMIIANKSVMGFNLIWLYERNELMKELLTEIEKLNLPAPKVGHQYAFSEMNKALEIFKGGKTVGKVVLTLT